MTTLMRYDPFREALSLRNAIDQLFAQSFVRPIGSIDGLASRVAPMNACETESGYQVRLLLPGVKPEDIELTVQQNTLTIKGQFKPMEEQDKQVNWLIHEIGAGSFERTVAFSKAVDADKITTSCEDGVLTISVPLSESSRPKRISVQGNQVQPKMVEAGSR